MEEEVLGMDHVTGTTIRYSWNPLLYVGLQDFFCNLHSQTCSNLNSIGIPLLIRIDPRSYYVIICISPFLGRHGGSCRNRFSFRNVKGGAS